MRGRSSRVGRERPPRRSRPWKTRASASQPHLRPSARRWWLRSQPWQRSRPAQNFLSNDQRPRTNDQTMKTLQRTLTIVKPDAVKRNAVGDIIEQFEKQGFHILSMKMLEISKHQAEQFYAVHASRPFYKSLTDFMSGGAIVVLALEKENAMATLS